MSETILKINNLKTYFKTDEGIAHAVDGLDLELDKGETLGIVGESGCGKSVTSLSIMKLIQSPPGYFESGEIIFKGQDLLTLSEREMRSIRGNKISMIFQEPMTSLNPVFTIGNQIVEAIILHQALNKNDAKDKAVEMLNLVGIPAPEQRFYEYPHQLSGGMRQRVMIAMALSCEPEILIADEPTTALDVTIQAQILDLIKKLQLDLDLSVMLITHDLGVVSQVCDRVLVMYAGVVVEYASTEEIFSNPLHPYTKALMDSIPKIDLQNKRLKTLKGMVPSIINIGEGCKLCSRFDGEECACGGSGEEPDLIDAGKSHFVRCNPTILKK